MAKKATTKKVAGARTGTNNGKLTPEEFILRAIEKLEHPKYKCVHVVYSGFNDAFKKYFDEEYDPREEVERLREAGKIDFRLVKGGPQIASPGTFRDRTDASSALSKMNLD
jgi:hypothetical protein